jgi:alanyl-tRNA synthetase
VTGSKIRQKYLEFFEKRGHAIVPSSPLIPLEDPSLLFTSAGMVQFKKFWATDTPLPYSRAASCQKCMRAGGKDSDLEKIGASGRHHTFFEMLGNFSFGDYFKEETIAWSWEFVTENLGISPDKIWVSYYEQDDETKNVWKRFLPESRIIPLGKEHNFWGPAGNTGPCGPCSELYLDYGERFSCGSRSCMPGCECDRFLEFWNLVFPQYDQQSDGSRQPLKRRGVDTGMGLERIARILQNVPSNYETDLILPVIRALEKISAVAYKKENTPAFRIISDHIRAAVFLIGDGVMPENEGRGYVLRRIIRRAYFQGQKLGLGKPFLCRMVPELVKINRETYPDLEKQKDFIEGIIREEEEKFIGLLETSERIIEQALTGSSDSAVSGDTLFKWYDTYGIPKDLIEEISVEKGFQPDWAGFEELLKQQQEKARKSSAFEEEVETICERSSLVETVFIGYEKTEGKSFVAGCYYLPKRKEWELVLDETPFYPEKGGQVGDTGIIEGDGWSFQVSSTRVNENGIILHAGTFVEGKDKISVGAQAFARVSIEHRMSVSANHTATHLLHYCLRETLGKQTKQAGSYVGQDKFRFDFLYSGKLEKERIDEIEKMVNHLIMENHPVRILETSFEEATKRGAIALFLEKYAERVRVIDIGGFHAELCGGTHVLSTSEIGFLTIESFSNIGENLKRIEAVTRFAAYEKMKEKLLLLRKAAEILHTRVESVPAAIDKMAEQMDQLQRKLNLAMEKFAKADLSKLRESARTVVIDGTAVRFISGRLDGLQLDMLGRAADDLAKGLPDAVVLLAGVLDNNVVAVCKVGKSAALKISASVFIKKLLARVQGTGGGKNQFAQGTGKNPGAIDAMLSEAGSILAESAAG